MPRGSCPPATRSSPCWPSTVSAEPASSRTSPSPSNRTRSSAWPAPAAAGPCRWPGGGGGGAVVGCPPPPPGTIRPRRGEVTGKGVFQALDRGVAFVPEDRHDEGL